MDDDPDYLRTVADRSPDPLQGLLDDISQTASGYRRIANARCPRCHGSDVEKEITEIAEHSARKWEGWRDALAAVITERAQDG